MKCPNCGEEIPEGKLLCESCGHEIAIVPEYDTVEQKISENMTRITEAIARQEAAESRRQKLLEEKERRHRRLIRMETAAIVFLLLFAAGTGTVLYFRLHSQSYYVGEAYKASRRGENDRAAELIDRAVSLETEPAAALIMEKADYQLRAGRFEAAAETLKALIADQEGALSEDELHRAYEALIDIYAAQNRYREIAALLAESRESIRELFPDYLVSPPIFDAPEGEYEDILYLSLRTECTGSIFYTTDGSEPTAEDHLYQEPLLLTEGEYSIAAVAVNRYGVYSDAVTMHYEVGTAVPDAPEVTTRSGGYTSPTLITVSPPSFGTVYYTTDGSDPTGESEEYTDPIVMPAGSSFYRFAVIAESGASSDIVERRYEFQPSGNLSIEEGPNYILVAMIRSGEVVDTVGTIRDGSARYAYYYKGLKTIGNYGNFYIYSEILVDAAGSSAETGRKFAVNLTNKTVNLYDDSGGKAVLTPLG
ncbi:chitobiase/beta-hexosaminidase C-terminal domain-containing protein [Lachnoclostridium sp. Marseille-P6806]|uniref:chitobiase/beta-hexosaminidase C-terminal domain-containing protein n=1 Tax=Lachnoclostridium sp. Marseille-P6806 TaxID=2364793 RepID=UPI0010323CDA|nr:chitobiase/beta-hexosaminidase C-terminal domain-containing protein [Lachnoclostridium sp. Marseille-P6806]